MPSENKTPNLGLNQWEGNEYPKREDFNEDNALVDGKVGDLEQGILDALNRANEAFQSASDGKVLLSGAITGKGVPTAPDDTFSKMATNINNIETDPSIGTTDAKAADLRQGKSAISQGKRIVGTIPSKGAATIIPTITEQRILAGQYLSGDQIIQAVNVPADKVLAGTTIAGRAGTMPNHSGSISNNQSSSNIISVFDFATDGGGAYGRVKLKSPFTGYVDNTTQIVQNIYGLNPAVVKKGSTIGISGTGGSVGTFTGVGTAGQPHVLSGHTFSNDSLMGAGGTMPNRGAPATTLTTQGGRYNIPAGYFSGGYVMAQFANLTPGNVRKGVNVGGQVGTLIPFDVTNIGGDANSPGTSGGAPHWVYVPGNKKTTISMPSNKNVMIIATGGGKSSVSRFLTVFVRGQSPIIIQDPGGWGMSDITQTSANFTANNDYDANSLMVISF